jgi:hypothetical protein
MIISVDLNTGDITQRELTQEEVAVLQYLEPVPPKPKQLTSLEFLDLFTEDEQLAIATAAIQIPHVKLWYDRTLAAMFITLADQRTEAGLTALVDAGMLTAERKAEIVGAMQ